MSHTAVVLSTLPPTLGPPLAVDSFSGDHFAYWAVEAAAIAFILKLDDTSLREHIVYPKDLGDFACNENRFHITFARVYESAVVMCALGERWLKMRSDCRYFDRLKMKCNISL